MKVFKWILILLSAGVGLYLGYRTFAISTLRDIASTSPSKQGLVDNYKLHEKDIFTLKRYFKSIVPVGFKVYIEFENDTTIDLWVFKNVINSDSSKSTLFKQWDINPYSYVEKPMTVLDSLYFSSQTKSLDDVKRQLGWHLETFRAIKDMLDNANCISVNNDEPTEIGFARSGMGKYFYTVFTSPIMETLKSSYNDSCTYILYNDRVVLQYGGGAVGPQCFPDLKRSNKK